MTLLHATSPSPATSCGIGHKATYGGDPGQPEIALPCKSGSLSAVFTDYFGADLGVLLPSVRDTLVNNDPQRLNDLISSQRLCVLVRVVVSIGHSRSSCWWRHVRTVYGRPGYLGDLAHLCC